MITPNTEPTPETPRPVKAEYNDLIQRAESMMKEVIGGLELPDAELPAELADYKPVAAFTSEAVTQTTNEWGVLKLTFKVNGETKWSAMRATDFAGQRLAIVVYASEG